MIHQKEWYTCDRCGADIEKTPREAGYIHFIHRKICKDFFDIGKGLKHIRLF